jgi:hypothetical protein
VNIRMLVEMTGTRDGQPWPRKGEEAELPTAAAAHLVASGIAEQVEDTGPDDKPRSKSRGGRRATVSDS